MSNQDIGTYGEQIAITYLQDNGFTILNHHFTTHWGELDIVARKANKLFFIEVKTRVGLAKGRPYEAVNYRKVQSLKRAIGYYLMKYGFKDYKYSLDVLSVVLTAGHSVESIKYYENAYM